MNIDSDNFPSGKINQIVDISTFELIFITVIQTDKPKYKPGDTINMRLFFTHFDGTAANTSEIRNFYVEIRSEYDEVLMTFEENNFTPKVYTCFYHLNEFAVEGNYKIHVWTNVEGDKIDQYNEDEVECYDIDDADYRDTCIADAKTKQIILRGPFNIRDSKSQNFMVEKYVLTEFTLNVDTKRIVPPYSEINLKISGAYSFGRNVIEIAKVHAKVELKSGEGTSYDTSVDIGKNGESYGIISIDTVKYLGLVNSNLDYHVHLKVVFIDDLSRKKAVKMLTITVSESDYSKLIMNPAEDFLTPGGRFKINVHLEDIDGNPVESSSSNVRMSVRKRYKAASCGPITKDLLNWSNITIGSQQIKNFVASFETDVPYNTTSMEFEAIYDHGIMRTLNVSISRKFLKILTTAPK